MPPRLFATDLTVRSYEVDLAGVVNNAVFVNYLEHARMGIFEELGFHYGAWVERGVVVVVRRLEIDYQRAARLGDRLRVESWVEQIGRTSVRLGQRVLREDGELLAGARVVGVFVDRDLRPTPVPDDLRTALPALAVGVPS